MDMPDNAREIFVRNLRYLMDARGITQADICRELNMSSTTVSDWCTGKKYPRVDAMQRLADLLGVLFSMLTTEEGPKNFDDQERIAALQRDPASLLVEDEKRLIAAYRGAEEMAKKIAIETLENNQKKNTKQSAI
jgi:transcriptional regulator with XRE-family HTH domain